MSAKRSYRVYFLLLAAAALFAFSDAQAGRIIAFQPEPIAVGDQLFDGGQIELEPVTASGLYAIRIDGRQIALVFFSSTGSRLEIGRPWLVFKRDLRGVHHFVALRHGLTGDGHLGSGAIRVATVARGVGTVSPLEAVAADVVAGAR